MLYVHGMENIKFNGPSSLAIGKFDGFHRGHRKLISELLSKKQEGIPTVLFTFSTSPQNFMQGRADDSLITAAERAQMAEELGIDILIEFPFTDRTRRIGAEEFVQKIISDALHVKHMVVGPDCTFGYRGVGDIAMLEDMSEKFGFDITIVSKLLYNGEVISSTRIRECLKCGLIGAANEMLGYEYTITGRVVHGLGMGSGMGIPTLNLELPENKMLPRRGVYLVRVRTGAGEYFGMANVGCKPTVQDGMPMGLEATIFDFGGDIYGSMVSVSFLEFIRPEEKFPNVAALLEQIGHDKKRARRLISESYM